MEDEINIIQIETSLQNYDRIIKQLNEELHKLQYDHNHLKIEFNAILEENKALSLRISELLKSKCNSENVVEANEQSINNLKEQIAELLTEKKTVMRLWQNSVKTVEKLEDQLQLFHAETERFIPKPELDKILISYEQKLRQMEQTLHCTKEKLHESLKNTLEEQDTRGIKFEKCLENQSTAFKIIKNLETEILKLQSRLEYTVEQKTYLERSLKYKDDILQGMKHKNAEYWAKITEAVSVVDAALNEKDAALLRQHEIKVENENLLKRMDEMIRDYENKIEKEVLIVTRDFEKKQLMLLEDINRAQCDIKIKETELEECKKKCILLENDFKNIKLSSTDGNVLKLLELERKMETTFQSLVNSEKQNIQLAAEKQTMKNDIDQMASLYETNIKAKNTELESLKLKMERLEGELDECHKDIDKMTSKINKLNQEVLNKEAELKGSNRSIAMLKDEYASKIKELTINYNKNVSDLQIQITHKNELIDRWKKESNSIITGLEKTVKHTKSQVQVLRQENKSVKQLYSKSLSKISNYKRFIEVISNDVGKLNVSTL
ncbi:uncharacterized protein LOC143190493 [Rhynchophorus ferrugineus]|uniref:uncharacterized protein LOC143190493 n=1 Tax=Rhynchophorus ferrugineus TaxID=354439 RepID=UPI003FCD266A